jgi:hypothetical protein
VAARILNSPFISEFDESQIGVLKVNNVACVWKGFFVVMPAVTQSFSKSSLSYCPKAI